VVVQVDQDILSAIHRIFHRTFAALEMATKLMLSN